MFYERYRKNLYEKYEEYVKNNTYIRYIDICTEMRLFPDKYLKLPRYLIAAIVLCHNCGCCTGF